MTLTEIKEYVEKMWPGVDVYVRHPFNQAIIKIDVALECRIDHEDKVYYSQVAVSTYVTGRDAVCSKDEMVNLLESKVRQMRLDYERYASKLPDGYTVSRWEGSVPPPVGVAYVGGEWVEGEPTTMMWGEEVPEYTPKHYTGWILHEIYPARIITG